jgi:uncharacterized protein (DUF1800 family)
VPSIVSPQETGPKARAVHILNRIGFGPRPGEIDRVLLRGAERYIEDQLFPEDIDDRAAEDRVATLSSWSASIAELLARYPQNMGSGRLLEELAFARLIRAVTSERQLYEVMVDFWFNHFNVYAPEGFTRYATASYERDAIRPFALGRFRDLLGATARHPAMLYYLDNWLSSVPRRQGNRIVGGLNENYGRELLELHTLGVDGGYTQEDIIQVSRAFTGWTLDNIRSSGQFRFDARIHDPGDKTILGRRIASGGMEEGEQVLDLLGEHDSTARFVSYRLCQRFIADDPPDSAVDRAAATFRATRGDIRRVMATILGSREFFDPAYWGSKPKTPLEYVASALRALGANPSNYAGPAQAVSNMGMPLYAQIPPTGYSNDGREWMNASGLLNRMNFVLDVLSGAARGVNPQLDSLLGNADRQNPTAVGQQVAEQIFGYRMSRTTWESATRRPASNVSVPVRVVSLMLAGPEFQAR